MEKGWSKRSREELFPEPKDRIIFALNTSDFVRAECLVRLLSGHVGYFKWGPELTSAMLSSLLCPSDRIAIDNMKMIRSIFNEAKGRIFWDGRLAGIATAIGPTTKTLADMGVSMLSVQAAQGLTSINAAIDNRGKSLLFAATPRSSVDHEECRAMKKTVLSSHVLRLKGVSIDGVICSSHETAPMREHFPDALIVTRDVRPDWVSVKDRRKVVTPAQAIADGADAVIIGKPISQPSSLFGDPTRAAERIVSEITEVLMR